MKQDGGASKRKRSQPASSSPVGPPTKRAKHDEQRTSDANPPLSTRQQRELKDDSPDTFAEAPGLTQQDGRAPDLMSAATQSRSIFGPFLASEHPSDHQPTPLPTPLDGKADEPADTGPNSDTSPKGRSKSKKTNSEGPEIDPLFWQDFEITGDLPGQPGDDGEGLDGVGFEAPPEKAHAASQKRKQAIADWKKKVLKEGREERSNRRSNVGTARASTTEETGRVHGLHDSPRKTVRFAAAQVI